jgi:transposase
VKRQRFTKEFKQEAVRLLRQADKPAAEIALELGVRRNQLYKWRDEIEKKGGSAFSGPGRKPLDQESEVSRLRRELERVKEERDILKKAAAYFAKELK